MNRGALEITETLNLHEPKKEGENEGKGYISHYRWLLYLQKIHSTEFIVALFA